jgi:flavin-dependent dehydrogenase
VKRIAVLGGGPAGAFAAERLATSGFEVQLFDEKLAWEKPCGGGLTHKAYTRYPFLLENDTPKRFITSMTIGARKAGTVSFQLDDPLLIYSRIDLNRLLLERAARAGARVERTRVLEMTRLESAWKLRTQNGDIETDFCVVATGARNPLRNAGTQLTARDTMWALGYYVPGERAGIDIQFLAPLEGYIWVFPRCSHLSVGICGKGEAASRLRARLERYMEERRISADGAKFYAHLLPSLDAGSWRMNRVSGDGWLAVGDAAGLVDPITGEGLYYALRSADLAAEALINGGVADYRTKLRSDFVSDLEFGALLAPRIYSGRFLFTSVTDRLVQFARHSPRFAGILQDLLAGRQPYSSLKGRLLANLHGSFYEVGMNLLLRGA